MSIQKEKMSREEYIQLFELLGKYRDELIPDIVEDYLKCESKYDLACQITLRNLINSIGLIRDVLVYEF